MTLVDLDSLTERQAAPIVTAVQRFGCTDDFTIEADPFDLPDGWALVIMGAKKGRLRSFGVSPAGDISS